MDFLLNIYEISTSTTVYTRTPENNTNFLQQLFTSEGGGRSGFPVPMPLHILPLFSYTSFHLSAKPCTGTPKLPGQINSTLKPNFIISSQNFLDICSLNKKLLMWFDNN